MKNSLLVFGTKNFNNSLNEIKEYLNFSLVFFNDNTLFKDRISNISALLIDSEVLNSEKNLNLINSVNNKPILLIEKPGFLKKYNYTDKVSSPLTLSDFNTRIITLITSSKFNKNAANSRNMISVLLRYISNSQIIFHS